MAYCNHPKCSTPIIKPLENAHLLLCGKSRVYHAWHHHPHHKKAHWTTLVVCFIVALSLVFNTLGIGLRKSKAASSFSASYNSSSLNADSGRGSVIASNDGTPAELVSGYGGSGQAVQVNQGESLKYEIGSGNSANLDKDRSAIEMRFKSSFSTSGTDSLAGGFNNPYGIAYDTANDYIYVADTSNNRIIRTRIDGSGWTTLGTESAGQGALQFQSPTGIAVGEDGYLYVSDTGNNRIVKTKIDGSGWTVLSSHYPYSFNLPLGIFYYNGDVYVADANNDRIVKTDADLSTWTNFGGVGQDMFSHPQSIYVDGSSSPAYVYATGRLQVFRIKTDGTGFGSFSSYSSGFVTVCELTGITAAGDNLYILIRGGGGEECANNEAGDLNSSIVETSWDAVDGWEVYNADSPFSTAALGGIAYGSGYFYIADTGNHRIIKTTYGDPWTGWTTLTYQNGQLAPLRQSLNPSDLGSGMFYDSSNDYIYIADTNNSRIVRTKADGTSFETFGSYGIGDGQFSHPRGIYYDSATGYLYISDNNHVVRTQWGGVNWSVVYYVPSPYGLYYDNQGTTGYLYILGFQKVYRYYWNGSAWSNWTQWGSPGSGIGQFNGYIYGIYVSDGYLYISDYGRIIRTTYQCASSACWSTHGAEGIGPGNDLIAGYTTGIYFDATNSNVYLANEGNNRISCVHWNGSGWDNRTNFGSEGSGKNQFSSPTGIFYSNGYVYVLDSGNKRIVKTQMDGTIWWTFDGNMRRTLLKTNGSFPMWLYFDIATNKFEFYVAYLERPVFLSSPSQSLTAGNWYKIKVVYNDTSGEAKMYLNDTLVVQMNTSSWQTPTGWGDHFYIGSSPSAVFENEAMEIPIDDINIDSHTDSIAPPNPGSVTAKSQLSGGVNITTNTWNRYGSPYFSWSEPEDTAGPEEIISGTAGYYVYFGANSQGDNNSDGIFDGVYQTTRDYIASNLTSGNTYYLLLKTKDNADNISSVSTLFTYKYDGNAPTSPAYINVSPSSWTRDNNFTFSWPTSGQYAASDTGGSEISSYKYRVRDGAWQDISQESIQSGSISLAGIGQSGASNTFSIKVIDNAGNESSSAQTNFYFNDQSPLHPDHVNAAPETTAQNPAAENRFRFAWNAPAGFDESNILGYYYSFNAKPSPQYPPKFIYKSQGNELPYDAYATQQGENYFYIIAKDNTSTSINDYSNVGNFVSCDNPNGSSSCARISFFVETPNPSEPRDVQVVDISNRDHSEYSTLLKWRIPSYTGTGVAAYEIYRSTGIGDTAEPGGITTQTCGQFSDSPIAIVSGNTYADDTVESQQYCYEIRSKDNANQKSAPSGVVTIVPVGSYTRPPVLKDGTLKVDEKTFSAVVTWETEDAENTEVNIHKATGKVIFGKDGDKLGVGSNDTIPSEPEPTTKHSVDITGLEPSTIYYYQAIWTDEDGNEGRSGIEKFTTKERPSAFDIAVPEQYITLNSVTIQYKTNVPATTEIIYGTSPDLGGESVGNRSGFVTEHIYNITGLNHSTKYYFKVVGVDVDGNKLDTAVSTPFETLTMPRIVGDNVEVDQVRDAPTTTYRFAWETNVETTSMVYYQAKDGSRLSKSDAEYTEKHEVLIPSLADMNTYTFEITGSDRHGNRIEKSFVKEVNTPLDSRPPKLSNMTIEVKSSGLGNTQKAQVVVTWETDEPATSQVEYEQGISGKEYKNQSKEDMSFSTSHVVILSELEPSKIYHLRAVSSDGARNEGHSDDTTVITGKMQQSVLDIILNSLEKSLGWVFKVFR